MSLDLNKSHRSFKILGVDHIAIASGDSENCLRFFSEVLPLAITGSEEVAHEKTAVTMISSQSIPEKGSTQIELLKATSPESVVARYLEKKGGGIHHIALRVDDISQAWQFLKDQGVECLGEGVKLGAGGCQVFFVHPRSTGGVLVEFVQR